MRQATWRHFRETSFKKGVQGLGFRGLRFRVQGLFEPQKNPQMIQRFGFRVKGLRFWVWAPQETHR